MAESLSPLSKEETLALVRRTYQEVIDTLLFISDDGNAVPADERRGKRASNGCGSIGVD